MRQRHRGRRNGLGGVGRGGCTSRIKELSRCQVKRSQILLYQSVQVRVHPSQVAKCVSESSLNSCVVTCDPVSPARRGKRYLLIYRRSDRAYASMFHAKAARLGARAQRQSMPRLGHINAGSRRANAESPKYRATPPQVSNHG